MTPTSPTCHACRTPLTFGAIEGFCPRCVGTMIQRDGSLAGTEPSFPAELRPGRFGDFELFEEVGRGGMGIVYRAWQIRLQREVAIKVLLQGPFADRGSVQRFQTEAAAAARLRHPNIVAIHEIGEWEGRHFFCMDFVAGGNLAQILRAGRTLPVQLAARIVEKIARAVHHAHQQGVLHRDLKPSNVLIDAAGEPRVTDFGLAKWMFGDSELTMTGQVLGSPNYIPPEQAEARHELVGVPSDVYSIGAVLYYLLAGRPPFSGENLAATLQQVLTQEPPALRSINGSIPADLETICFKCLEKDPARRYASAQDVAEELGRFLRDEPIQARRVGTVERAWRWCRRRPVVAALGAASAVLLLGIAAVSTLAAARAARSRETIAANLYAADIKAVQQAWSQHNFIRAETLLEIHRPQAGEPDRRGFEWYLFHEWCKNGRSLTLLTQTNGLLDLAVDDQGKYVAVIDSRRLQIIALANARVIRSWELLANNEGRAIAFLDGSGIVVSSERDGLLLHEVKTGLERRLEMGPEDSVAVSRDGAAVAVFGPLRNRKSRGRPPPLQVIRFGEAQPGGAQVSNATPGPEWFEVEIPPAVDVRRTASRGNPNSNPTPGPEDASAGRVGPVTLPLFDGRVAEAHWGGALVVRESKTGPILWSVPGLPRQRVKLAINQSNPASGLLAHTGLDQLIHLRDLTDGRELARLEGHTGLITRIQFHPTGTSLLSCGQDGRVIQWETPQLTPLREPGTISDLTSAGNAPGTTTTTPLWSPDGMYMALATPNNLPPAFGIYRRANLSKVAALAGKPVSFSPDGKSLLLNLDRDGFRFVHVPGWTNASGFRLPLGTGSIEAQLSPDGRLLAAADPDERLIVFDATTGQPQATNTAAAWQFVFTPDSQSLVVASTNRVFLWNYPGNATRPLLDGRGDAFTLTPDGKKIAIGTAAHDIRVIELSSGKAGVLLSGHHGAILALACSPDGRTLVSSGEDRTVRFWSLSTMREMAAISRDTPVRHLQFDHTGDHLVLGTSDDYVVWSATRDRDLRAATALTKEPPAGTIWQSAVPLARRYPQ